MKNYLHKAAQDPDTKDIRVKNSRARSYSPSGAPQLLPSSASGALPAIPTSAPRQMQDSRRGKRPRLDVSNVSSPSIMTTEQSRISVPATDPRSRTDLRKSPHAPSPRTPPRATQDPRRGKHTNHQSASHQALAPTRQSGFPAPDARLGADINPFDTMPRFTDCAVNTERLKWSCKWESTS